jgi:hypothetical protein
MESILNNSSVPTAHTQKFLTMQKSIILALSLITIAFPSTLILTQTAPAHAQTQKAKTTTHKIGNVTFKTPNNWINRSEPDNIVLDNKKAPIRGGGWAPKGSIRVIGWILDKPLEEAVTERSDDRSIGKVTEKTENLTIGNQAAIRLHQTHEDGFPASITTAIATGDNRTIMIVTFYSDKTTEQQVKQIQQTIRVK